MRKIILSLLTVLMVSSTAVGATQAYFSDTALSENNSFSAGNLDIRIAKPGTGVEMPFSVTGLEPGAKATKYITVVNDGDIPVKWRAYISGGDGGALFNALRVESVKMRPSSYTGYGAITGAGYTIAGPLNYEILTAAVNFSDLLVPSSSPLVWESSSTTEPFRPGWAATYAIEVGMDPNAGNSYQGTSWSGTLTFYATQDSNPGW